MKRTLLASIILILTCNALNLLAQNKASTFTINGVALNQENDDPIQFAQAALFKKGAKEPETFTTTNEDGSFSMSAKSGTYQLKIFFVGYEDKLVEDIKLTQDLNLETVFMTSDSKQLAEVEVQGSKPLMQTNVEGITINPSKNLSNLGGTLLDILRNTPSVRVGNDGSISLRGSAGTNILINGRNSSLTNNLDRIPASAIEKIKVINNPNARYDAEAEAGIIDIILKRGDDLGTNGGVNALYGSRGRLSGGGQFNHRDIRYNVYAGYNVRRWKSLGNTTRFREIFEDGEALDQETNSIGEDLGQTFNYGASYYFGENTLSYEGIYSTSYDQQVNTLFSKLINIDTDELLLEYVRRNSENESDDGYDNALIL
jgi:hypothetical protein